MELAVTDDALRQCLAPSRPSASVTRCLRPYKTANYETGAIATVILQTKRLRPKEAESLAQTDTGHRMGGLTSNSCNWPQIYLLNHCAHDVNKLLFYR